MRFRWVKQPLRSRSQHATSGNRRGIRIGHADEHYGNRARELRIGTSAISIRASGAGCICQRTCPVEKCRSGKRRHHGHVPSAGG